MHLIYLKNTPVRSNANYYFAENRLLLNLFIIINKLNNHVYSHGYTIQNIQWETNNVVTIYLLKYEDLLQKSRDCIKNPK